MLLTSRKKNSLSSLILDRNLYLFIFLVPKQRSLGIKPHVPVRDSPQKLHRRQNLAAVHRPEGQKLKSLRVDHSLDLLGEKKKKQKHEETSPERQHYIKMKSYVAKPGSSEVDFLKLAAKTTSA